METMELSANLLKKLNKIAVIRNFLAVFLFLFEKFSLLDPDPGGKMNADPCGSGSTALENRLQYFTLNGWNKDKINFSKIASKCSTGGSFCSFFEFSQQKK